MNKIAQVKFFPQSISDFRVISYIVSTPTGLCLSENQ